MGKLVACVTILLLLGIGAGVLLAASAERILDIDAGRLAVMPITTSLLAILSASLLVHEVRRKHKRMASKIGETYIGNAGLFCNGEFLPWTSLALRVRDAWVENGSPAVLVFEFALHHHRIGDQQVLKRVPVPRGQEWAAAQFVDLFRAFS